MLLVTLPVTMVSLKSLEAADKINFSSAVVGNAPGFPGTVESDFAIIGEREPIVDKGRILNDNDAVVRGQALGEGDSGFIAHHNLAVGRVGHRAGQP